MKIKKTLCAAFAAIVTAVCALSSFASVPTRPAQGYLRDIAGALDPDSAEELDSVAAALHEKNGAGIYLLVSAGFDGLGGEKYASSAFEAWDLTERDLLLCVDTAGADYYALAGGELSGTLGTDALKDILSRSFEPAFASGNISAASLSFFNAVSPRLANASFTDGDGGTSPFAIIILTVVLLAAAAFIVIYVIRTVNINRARRRRMAARRSSRPLPPRRPMR